MAFTESYVQTAGSNLNAGSTTDDVAAFTFTSGNWVEATGVFTAAGANLSGITVGMFASVYIDGATVTGFVGRVLAVDDGADTITINLSVKSGTPPTDGTGNRSIKVGGAWKGPNGAEAFPFGFVQNTMTNSAGDFPRVNIKGGTNYDITAAMTHANAGPCRFQGYTTSVGDGGRFTIDGGTTGASYVLLTISGAGNDLVDAIFQNNGATGSATGLSLTGKTYARGIVVNSVRGTGLSTTGSGSFIEECETYGCNQSNTASMAGIIPGTTCAIRHVISHDNIGSNNSGAYFTTTGTVTLDRCIFEGNGLHGISMGGAAVTLYASHCECYNNAGDGMRMANTGAATVIIKNSNFIKNGGYGINGSGAGSRVGAIINCGFGAGTQANTSGTTTGLSAMEAIGSVTYDADVTPWVDPANGDFRITLAASIGTGRGTFLQTQAGYAGTVGYPDIGAAQHTDIIYGTTAAALRAALGLAAANVDTQLAAIQTKTDFLPSAVAGAAGGLFIAGTNAPVTITGSGNALTLLSSGANGMGLKITGDGTGDGVEIKSGAGSTGNAITAIAQSTDGLGIRLLGTGTGDGFSSIGGANGSGMNLAAGATSGAGLYARGMGSGNDIDAPDTTFDQATNIQSRIPAALVGGRMDSSVGAIATNAITAASIADGAIDAATFAAGAINAAAIAADAITDAKVASDVTIASVTGAVGSVTGAVGSVTGAAGSVTGAVGSVIGAVGSVTGAVGSVASGGITAASIADGAIDRATFAADTGLQSIRSNTAQAGAASTITLDASASFVTDFYAGAWIYITGGTGVGQSRLCTAYNFTTKVATVSPSWATNPDVTSTFAVLAAGSADLYHAAIETAFDDDAGVLADEYTIRWFKNGVRITSGITSPTIQLIARDGTDLVAATAMTQIGTTGAYKYDATGAGRLAAGSGVEAVVSATIDGATRTFSEPVIRDRVS